MIFGSVCSGIEAASVAWNPLGWKCQFVSEIEPFPCAVLAHHYATVPNHGDMTCFKDWPDANIDVLCGGTPCQSFSNAGLRAGLDDPRGNLMLTFGAVADRYRPRWLLWENVPGVLSSNEGRDFGTFLGLLGILGYGFAYRVLDAQYFGLAQRRKRVFVVACLGDWRSAAAVLFEPESLRGDSAPRRSAQQSTAGTIAGGARKRGGYSTDDIPIAGTLNAGMGRRSAEDPERGLLAFGGNKTSGPRDTASALSAHGGSGRMDFETETFIAFDTTQITNASNRSNPQPGDACHTLAKGAHAPAIAFTAKDYGGDATFDLSPTLRAGTHSGSHANAGVMPAIAFPQNLSATQHASAEDIAPSMGAKNPTAVSTSMQVRRLTPRECERLMGFPEDYTAISVRGKPAADGPRYKALGNSWAVPCIAWIGKRIQMVDGVRSAMSVMP